MKIYLTDLKGNNHVLDAVEGWSLMEIIRDHNFPMKAECGGSCACATCHVYINPEWVGKLPEASSEEIYMIDDAFHVQENSRLSCQIILSKELDGLKVILAKNPD